jgi:hypothetical protein
MAEHDQAPHADTDPRRGPALDRVNMPDGLRRERKPPYGPKTGRTPENSRRAQDEHVAEKE